MESKITNLKRIKQGRSVNFGELIKNSLCKMIMAVLDYVTTIRILGVKLKQSKLRDVKYPYTVYNECVWPKGTRLCRI